MQVRILLCKRDKETLDRLYNKYKQRLRDNIPVCITEFSGYKHASGMLEDIYIDEDKLIGVVETDEKFHDIDITRMQVRTHFGDHQGTWTIIKKEA